MSAAYVELGSVADFINGAAFKPEDWGDEGLRIIRIQNLTDARKPYNRTKRKVADKLRVRKGDLLVSWSATLGVFEWQDEEDALLNQHIFRVVPDEERVDTCYLKHLLEGALVDMQKHLHGATMQHVNRGEFLATKVFLPPLSEQRRIAAVLDAADALRAKRKAALAQLDQLTGAIFIEMFGDPATNRKGWKSAVLGDLIDYATDGPHVSPVYSETGIPFISTRHVQRGRVNWTDLKYITPEEAEVQWRKCRPERGDVLYTKGGTTGIAATVDTDEPFAVWVHVALLKTRPELAAPHWLEAMLNHPFCYAQSQRFTHGIANRDLGLTRMVKIQMFAPPIELQREFCQRRAKLVGVRANVERSAVALGALFASLQHRAFRGEL